jgi:hypothetical protein
VPVAPARFKLFLILENLRGKLEVIFSPDTAVGGVRGETPSAGHCAAVALMLQRFFGGELLSTTVFGQSHWFNRIWFEGSAYDVDLTADQFGLGQVIIAHEGYLHIPCRVRKLDEANADTKQRSMLLEQRLGYNPCLVCYEGDSGGYILCPECYTARQGSS